MEENQPSDQTTQNIKNLLALLDQEDNSVCESAIQALVETGEEALSLLIQALNDDEVGIRAGAASALGQIRDLRAVEPLINAFSDQFRRVKVCAAKALGQIGLPAVEPVVAALERERKLYYNNRDWLANALVEIGEAAIAPLSALLIEEANQPNYWAVSVLGRIGTPALEALDKALKSENPEVRAETAQALGHINDPRAIELLSLALKDKESKVRINAMFALGDSKNAAALDPLISALEESKQDFVATAVSALGRLGDPGAIESLIATFSTKNNYELHAQIAYALQHIGTAAVAPLILALENDDPAIRAGAAFALGHKSNQMKTDVTQALLRVLKDENTEVRYNAASALGHLNDPQVLPVLKLIAQTDKGQNLQGKRVAAIAARSIEKINNALEQTVASDRRYKLEKAENLKKLNKLISEIPELEALGFLEETNRPAPDEVISSLFRISNEPFSRISDTTPQEEIIKWIRNCLKEARIKDKCYLLFYYNIAWLEVAVGPANVGLIELIAQKNLRLLIVSKDRKVALNFFPVEYYNDVYMAFQDPNGKWITPYHVPD